MQHKKGFTLVELLVALVCTTLVLSMVASAAVFLTRMNNGALKESQTYFQLQTLETFVKNHIESDFTSATEIAVLNNGYSVENGTVTYNEQATDESGNTINNVTTVVSDSEITGISFSVNEDTTTYTGETIYIVTCTVTYGENQTFAFVAYSSKSPSDSATE